MKKIIYLLLITVLFTACSKNKDFNLFSANQNCQILKIEADDDSYKTTETLSYDDKGNLVKIEVKTVEVKTKKEVVQIYTYTYSKQSIVHKRLASNGTATIITYSLDDSGKIISAKKNVSNPTSGEIIMDNNIINYEYKYTDDGYLREVIKTISNQEFTDGKTYTWQNGNITSIGKNTTIFGSTITTDTFSYEYGTDVWPVTFLFLDTSEFEDDKAEDDKADSYLRKYFGKLPKNLSSRKITGKNGENAREMEYAYQKDDKGNITKVSAVEKNQQGTNKSKFITYQYNCKVKRVKKYS